MGSAPLSYINLALITILISRHYVIVITKIFIDLRGWYFTFLLQNVDYRPLEYDYLPW